MSLRMNNPIPDRPPSADPAVRTLTVPRRHPPGNSRFWDPLILAAFVFGFGLGYLIWGRPAGQELATLESAGNTRDSQAAGDISLAVEVNPPEGFILPAVYGDIGPQLLSSGAIDEARFLAALQQAGQPASAEQLRILQNGVAAPITIDRSNARFLLNLFWALGLTNRNSILDEGPMVRYSEGQIGRYASTGGWTLGQKPATELYSSTALLSLTPRQQANLEEVATAVYRPCCDNPTHFPDCNHGMAMLGFLELMASQDATPDEMFAAAKSLNAFWFPQQTLEQAAYFKITQGQDFSTVDPRLIVSREISSSSGFQSVHRWLADNGVLEKAPGGGSSCGV